MDNYNIHDAPSRGPPQGGLPHSMQQMPPGPGRQGPPPVPQLPPQMFTTAAQLLDLTDKKLMISLRDGRKLIGVLRSWDQFGNLVLQDTIERYFVDNLYADVERGLFLVRGENVLLLGEIDLDKDDYVPASFEQRSATEVHALQKEKEMQRRKVDKTKQKRLAAYGFEGDHAGEGIL